MQVWHYSLPSIGYEGWARFLVSADGMLAVCSDFGSYAYHWHITNVEDAHFRLFLLRLDNSYLIRKLGGERGPVFDEDATVQRIKKTICEQRREQWLSADEAATEWDLLHEIEISNEFRFHEWYLRTALGDASELACYSAPPQLVAFVERVWPRFRHLLEQELEQEHATTTA